MMQKNTKRNDYDQNDQIKYTYIQQRKIITVVRMQKTSTQFKEDLIQLRSDFMNYTKQHKTKSIPLQSGPRCYTSKIYNNSANQPIIIGQQMRNKHLLTYLDQQISLKDQVNKMKLSKPSVIDIAYHPHCDAHLHQRICDILFHIKKKSTNYIKFITKAEFLGFKLLVVVLERQAIFYDCQEKKITRLVQFKYHDVRNKMLNNHHLQMLQNKQKNYDQYNSNMMGLIQNSSELGLKNQNHNLSNLKQNYEEYDKVNSISRRTEDRPRSFSLKSRKNTNQTQQLKNVMIGNNNLKNSKVNSSASACSQTVQEYKRATTMLDFQNPQIVRSITKVNRLRQKQKQKQRQKLKKQQIKVRSNDTTSILKLITDSKIQGSIQTIKAYRNSIETFQKYVQIDKSKLQKQKDMLEQYKPPSGVTLKFDYKKEINALKSKSKELTSKRKQYMKSYNSHHNEIVVNKNKTSPQNYQTNSKSRVKNRSHTQNQPIIIDELNQKGNQNSNQLNRQISPNRISVSTKLPQKDNTSDAFIALEKKILEIQSISFCDNFMLVSLMNCQLRLYSFKKTIHGFSETLIFEKNYQSVITQVVLFKSSVRKMYNICVVLSKFSVESSSNQANSMANPSGHLNSGSKSQHKQDQVNLRQANSGGVKIRETQLNVYELDSKMQIQKQSYTTYLSYSPILVVMLPLGIGGFTQSGFFFVLELNCTSKTKSQIKSIDTTLYNPDNGKRVSISCMRCHKNLVNLYIGCKDGYIYIYDRLTETVRLKGKISNHEIIQIMFINQNHEILFWDTSGKVGIVNSQNLNVSNVVSIMSSMNKDSAGQSNSQYRGMLDYFLDDEFLIYGDRNIGLVSLFVNQQKKFHVEKPIKIFNRRLTLKNRKSITSALEKLPQQNEDMNSKSIGSVSKKIYSYFSNPDSLIISTCQGQIIVYDKRTVYIGSYFSLNYRTMTKCINCPSIKYLYLLFQNNEMGVVNLYTQQQLLSIINVKQEVYQIFFCHSSVYFCGYLSAKKYELQIYGNIDESYIAKKRKGSVSPLIVVSLFNIIMDISPAGQGDSQSKLSKISKKSTISDSNFIDLSTHFYKGSMIIVKHQTAQILFLYKKSYTRNCVIRCSEYLPKTQADQRIKISKKNSMQMSPSQIQVENEKKRENYTIQHSYLDDQSFTLSIILSNHIIMLINIETKIIKSIFKLETKTIRNYVTMGTCNMSRSSFQKQKQMMAINNQMTKYKSAISDYLVKKKKESSQNENDIEYQPLEHYFNLNDGHLTVLWKIQSNEETVKDISTFSTINNTMNSNLKNGKPIKYAYTEYNMEIMAEQPQTERDIKKFKQIKQINIKHIIKSQPKQSLQKKPTQYLNYPQIFNFMHFYLNPNFQLNSEQTKKEQPSSNNTNTGGELGIKRKTSYNNVSPAQTADKNYIEAIKQGMQEWQSCPILLGQSFLTLNTDFSHFNLYKIHKQKKNKRNLFDERVTEHQSQKKDEGTLQNMTKQEQLLVQYYRIKPEQI